MTEQDELNGHCHALMETITQRDPEPAMAIAALAVVMTTMASHTITREEWNVLKHELDELYAMRDKICDRS